MDIVKLSTDWARAEVFSAKIVWLFSAITIMAAIGFWYFGKTVMARAFFWPLLVSGIFLAVIGAGLYLANNPRITRLGEPEQIVNKLNAEGKIENSLKVLKLDEVFLC
jgi:ABC-2 type transport system permease protein